MKTTSSQHSMIVALASGAAAALLASNVMAASPSPKNQKSAQQQIAELQGKVKQLEAALAAQSHASPSPAMNAGGGMQMGGMNAGRGMNMQSSATPSASMPMGIGDMQNMSSSNQNEMMGMMGMMNEMKMSGMTSGSGMAGMPKSALPGFPGVSHLYHIGATGLFLDHADPNNLTPDQQTALNNLKEQALTAKSHSEHQIEQAEQELANLTSADQPDAVKIDQKVREIEKLRSDERLAFIRSVGNSAKLLTEDQRKILTGAMQPATPAPSPSAAMSPMSEM